MNCDRCGQRVNEVPACEHRFVGQAVDGTLRCTYCGHNFGPVRELIEAKECPSMTLTEKELLDQIATLTRERDESQGREVRSTNASLGLRRDLDEANAKVFTLTRERDEARGWAEQRLDHIHLCQMAKTTLTCERDEAVKERDEARQQWREAVDCLDTWKGIADAARARIAELEKVPMSTTITLNSNGTWEGRKV